MNSIWIDRPGNKLISTWGYLKEDAVPHIKAQLFMLEADASNENDGQGWSELWGFSGRWGGGKAFVIGKYRGRWVGFKPALKDDGTVLLRDDYYRMLEEEAPQKEAGHG